jgi:hypothetical protein
LQKLYSNGELKKPYELSALLPWMLAQDLNFYIAAHEYERRVRRRRRRGPLEGKSIRRTYSEVDPIFQWFGGGIFLTRASINLDHKPH